jgi:tol-pal system protein YbgF
MRLMPGLAVMLFLPLAAVAPGVPPGAAQGAAQAPDSQTLADVRADLTALNGEISALRAELQVSGRAAAEGIANTAPLLARLDALEAALRDLTGKVERVELRVGQVVEDGTRRIGDLEFRLVELEGGDTSALGATPTLGGEDAGGTAGGAAGGTAVAAVDPAPDAPPLAVSEQADFDTALAAFEAGNHAEAAERFAAFTANYPGGPLSGDANFWRGEALSAQGQWREAARAYLDSFSGAPDGAKAPEALLRLGVALGRIGQADQACLTLAEVANRYPQAASGVLEQAQAERGSLGCR